MVTGTVTNMMTGKGRFVLDYDGELLSGEATRVRGDERRGIANAYGPRGTYMSCDYRMTSAYQGTGTVHTVERRALYRSRRQLTGTALLLVLVALGAG